MDKQEDEHAPLLAPTMVGASKRHHYSEQLRAGPVDTPLTGPSLQEATRSRYDPTFGDERVLDEDGCYMSIVRAVGNVCGLLRTYVPCCSRCCPGDAYYQTVHPNEAGVVADFGRYVRTVPPGTHRVVPFAQEMHRVSVCERLLDMSKQPVQTRDGCTVSADGMLYYRVVDPRTALYDVQDLSTCLDKLAQTALRDVFAGYALQECLDERHEIAANICATVREGSRAWGVHVRAVLIENIRPDAEMTKQLAANIVAKRRAEAAVTDAQGQMEATAIQARGQADAAIIKAQGQVKAAVIQAQEQVEAAAIQARGQADAAAIKAQGQAKATVIHAQGQAEAVLIKAQGQAKAILIEAQGQANAAKLMRDTANMLDTPTALQLRALDTLKEISSKEGARVIYVPMASSMVGHAGVVSPSAIVPGTEHLTL